MTGVTGTFLEKIVAARRRRLEESRARVPLGMLQAMAEARLERRDFVQAISGESPRSDRVELRVIAELKRASPSRGLICQRYRRREIAQGYEAVGASALSVLTEERYFMGSLDDLEQVRESVRLPVLRKDFILEEYQVYESVAAGADALLLIVAVLSDGNLRNLIESCDRMRIAALVEVHAEDEIDRALAAGARIIGVNNRDLKSLEVKPETSMRLRSRIPSTCLAVSESGVKKGEDLRRLAEAGYNAVLIGEHLMTAPDPGRALAELLDGAKALARPGA